MSYAEEVLSLKVMINKEKTKVLFAEADSDFADVLISFLTLPLGTIVRVLEKHYGDEAPVIGSLTTLYNGLANLDSVHFWTEGGKQMLLNPRSSFEAECRKLKLNVDDTQPTKYFTCEDSDCKRKRSPTVSMYYDTMKCDCGKSLSKAMGAIESKTQADDSDGGVFTEKQVSFLLTDDLQMAPNVPVSLIQTLLNLGITVPDGAELRNVTLGFNEIVDLLKGSLLSKTPLTDLILHKRCRTNCETVDLQHQMDKESSCNSKKMFVTAFVQQSTNKLLFAQAEEDFVDFLFSLLIIPLGAVEFLLSNNTSFTCIDNLYKSIANLIDDKYLRTPDTRNRLIKPDLPPKYLTKNKIFPLSEQMTPTIYYIERVIAKGPPSSCTVEKGFWMCFKDPKGGESYVKRPRTFMITDDLNVIPLKKGSSLSVLNSLKVPLSDLKILDLHIGLEEALCILKASLRSTSALTDGLINPILEKHPKQEHGV